MKTNAIPKAAAEPENPSGQPLFLSPVQAGFPTPAADDVERSLNLHEHLVRNPAATFFLKASGHSMVAAGIHDGDLLVVDRSLEAGNRRIVIASLDGELTVKRLELRQGRVWLVPANPDYPALDITGQDTVQIWGVVTHVIHQL